MHMLRKFIGTKAFYRSVLIILLSCVALCVVKKGARRWCC